MANLEAAMNSTGVDGDPLFVLQQAQAQASRAEAEPSPSSLLPGAVSFAGIEIPASICVLTLAHTPAETETIRNDVRLGFALANEAEAKLSHLLALLL